MTNDQRDASDTTTRAREAHDAPHVHRARGTALVTVAELAGRLGVSRHFVYEHADELGAYRLGDGPKARLRFDLERAMACFACRRSSEPKPAQEAASRPRRRRSLGTHVELLPIRGRIRPEMARPEAA